MDWVYNDGGRKNAGYQGDARDCVTRAVAIVTGLPYNEVYKMVWKEKADYFLKNYPNMGKVSGSPRNGVPKKVTRKVMEKLGWSWTPTMGFGTGCTVHVKKEELPAGIIMLQLSKHVCAVIDGIIHDTYDCSRGGTRCVYGYWSKS